VRTRAGGCPSCGWGDRIHGELLKLSFALDPKTVKNIMRRHHLPPAPVRGTSSWRTFLSHYKQQMLACDFFTVETLWLKALYVLFFIELNTRRVYLAGCTDHPNSAWVTQQARQLTWQLAEMRTEREPLRYLIHDHDTKFTRSFDAVFEVEGMEIILTPCHTPQANAIAERWVRSVRQEALVPIVVLGQRHLRRVLVEYVDFYNRARPHQGIEQDMPIPRSLGVMDGPIGRREVLGGILHDYSPQAA
jgi:transposase InsO family protein